MAITYIMSEVLDTLQASAGNLLSLNTLAPVRRGMTPHCFILDAKPALLDFSGETATMQMAALLQAVPLYRINLELTLDAALMARVDNDSLNAALVKAFAPDSLPTTLHADDNETGGLHHPMLEHLDTNMLANIYVRLLRALEGAAPAYSFERAILGTHIEQFNKLFDGFIIGAVGWIKAEILLKHGQRPDHTPDKPLEDYIAGGAQSAQGMDVADAREALWAWLEADQDQSRRCRDIDRLKTMLPNLRTPDWVRDDIFALLKKEAMKQHFADVLLPNLVLLEKAPSITQAVLANAQGQVDDSLRQLLAQTLNIDAGYSGAAGKFADVAQARRYEAVAAKLV